MKRMLPMCLCNFQLHFIHIKKHAITYIHICQVTEWKDSSREDWLISIIVNGWIALLLGVICNMVQLILVKYRPLFINIIINNSHWLHKNNYYYIVMLDDSCCIHLLINWKKIVKSNPAKTNRCEIPEKFFEAVAYRVSNK